MKLALVKGSTSKLLQLFIQDSSSTTGVGLTGLVFNTASLTAYYYREGAGSAVAITLATMTLGTWASGGFVVVDGTNMPGVYQLGIPNAALASGANSVVVMLKGASNMAPALLEIQLTDFDLHSATAAANVTQISGDTTAADNAEAFFDGTGYAGTNNVIPTVTTVNGLAANTITATAIAADAITAAKIADGAIDAATFAAGAIDAAAIATDAIGSAELAASAVSEIATAVNAEVVDGLAVDTYAEPGAVPAATATLAAKIGWLYTLARNKITQTATTQTLRNDGDSSSIGTSTVSDDSTVFTRGKWS
jgi:hypothetical protein